jgi:cytochrome c-type biogenesis protein CcsB
VTVAINSSYATLSDTLFTTAIATYSVAMIAYTAEYAFGRRGRVAETAAIAIPAPSRVLVGAAGLTADDAAAGLATDDASATPPTKSLTPVSDARRRVAGSRFGRAAVALTILGALFHAGSIAVRGAAVDEVPWSNMYEFSAVVGLIAVLAFLGVLARAPQIRYLGVFVMLPVVLVMFLAGTVLYAQASPLVPALQSYWLAIHVTAAASSEGVLMTSSVLTILYLIKRRYDANVAASRSIRFPISLGSRLPDPAVLDKNAYRLAAFAFPIYTFGVIAGAIWAEAAWGRYWGWDPKETWAFIAWVVFAAYLHARATGGMRKYAPWINLLGFGAMTFNFFVVNIVISGLHSYAGLN